MRILPLPPTRIFDTKFNSPDGFFEKPHQYWLFLKKKSFQTYDSLIHFFGHIKWNFSSVLLVNKKGTFLGIL